MRGTSQNAGDQLKITIVWGPIMLTLLIGTGLLLSIRMGFPQFTRFAYVMKNTHTKKANSTASHLNPKPF